MAFTFLRSRFPPFKKPVWSHVAQVKGKRVMFAVYPVWNEVGRIYRLVHTEGVGECSHFPTNRMWNENLFEKTPSSSHDLLCYFMVKIQGFGDFLHLSPSTFQIYPWLWPALSFPLKLKRWLHFHSLAKWDFSCNPLEFKRDVLFFSWGTFEVPFKNNASRIFFPNTI